MSEFTRREVLAGLGAAAGGWVVLRGGDETVSGGVIEDGYPRAESLRPVMGGTHITAENVDGYGTLGIGADRGGDPVVVTNRHVVDKGSDEKPSEIEGRRVFQPEEPIGVVSEASTIGGAGSSDWAVIRVSESVARTTQALGVGSVGSSVSPSSGDRVVIDGARTGLLGGTVERESVDANFRGELYNNMIEYTVDENRDTAGNSGGLVGVIDAGTFRPVGLHTFSIDEYRYAIHWDDLPDDVDATAAGASASAPDTEARVEGVIYARDGSGTHVWVANVGGALAERVVSLSDPSTGDVVDSTSVSLDPLARQAVTLDGGDASKLRLQVGATDVVTEITT